jgi:hypothetical protein
MDFCKYPGSIDDSLSDTKSSGIFICSERMRQIVNLVSRCVSQRQVKTHIDPPRDLQE